RTDFAALSLAFSTPTENLVNPVADQQIDMGTVSTLTTGAGITVAVLDTGVQADHPSLQGHLLEGYNALSPKDAPDDIPDGTQNSVVGHGTMVAGIISQMAPDAKILPVRILNGDGNGSLFSVVRGLRWAVNHGANVVNLSFGSITSSSVLQHVIS